MITDKKVVPVYCHHCECYTDTEIAWQQFPKMSAQIGTCKDCKFTVTLEVIRYNERNPKYRKAQR